MERFQREARAASSLDHPNICTIYEIGEYQRRACIAIQMLEGQTQRERIASKPFDLELTLQTALQIADALDSAHVARHQLAGNLRAGCAVALSRGRQRLAACNPGFATKRGGAAWSAN